MVQPKKKPVKASRRKRPEDVNGLPLNSDGLCVCAEAPGPHAQHREELYSAVAPPSEAALTGMLAAIKETDGAEIPQEQWPLAEVLASRGLVTLGVARGPGSRWRRAVPVTMKQLLESAPDFAELEQRVLAAGAEREPVERMTLAEKYGGRTTPPASRWTQFEQHVLMDLRAARKALASASGMAESDGFIMWAGEARELAMRVNKLVMDIEAAWKRAQS